MGLYRTIATAKSVDEEGYVWECPDFFNGRSGYLIMSPQGIKANGLKYRTTIKPAI